MPTDEQQYLYYDDLTATWHPATLAQIVAINNPDLAICPLNADGTPGPQTTYAAILKRSTAFARPASTGSSNHSNHSHGTPKARSSSSSSPLSAEAEHTILYTCNYIRHTLTILLFLTFAGIGTLFTSPRNPEIGLLISLAVGLISVIIIQLLSKPSTPK